MLPIRAPTQSDPNKRLVVRGALVLPEDSRNGRGVAKARY